MPIAESTTASILPAEGDQAPGGTERILLVDDEKALVRMLAEMLTGLGYRVDTHTISAGALEAFKDSPDAFDLVLTDMTMPGLTGTQLAAEIKRIRPDIPIIVCTGYSDLISESKCKELGLEGFLKKPVIKLDLAQAIQKVLKKSNAN